MFYFCMSFIINLQMLWSTIGVESQNIPSYNWNISNDRVAATFVQNMKWKNDIFRMLINISRYIPWNHLKWAVVIQKECIIQPPSPLLKSRIWSHKIVKQKTVWLGKIRISFYCGNFNYERNLKKIHVEKFCLWLFCSLTFAGS